MKRVMIYAYTFGNLGDDLFIQTLCERYPKTTFILHAPKVYKKHFAYIRNLVVIPNNHFLTKAINYAGQKINIHALSQRLIASRCDGAVHIGGSLFIQSDNWKSNFKNISAMHRNGKPFFLLGANFGPYKDRDFLTAHKELFQNYTDICFREKYTYELFQDLENVRFADDVIFQLNPKLPKQQKNNLIYLTELHKKRNQKRLTAVISLIKPSIRPELALYDEVYYEKISEIASYLIQKNFDVTLMSFCEHEGDNEAVSEIMNRMTATELQRISAHYYQLNIGAALAIISQAKFIVATRFHAMILGWIYEKPVYPIVYSNKMLHVMQDIGFSGAYTNINTIMEIQPTEVFASIQTNQIPVDKQIKNAEKQFEKLDAFLA